MWTATKKYPTPAHNLGRHVYKHVVREDQWANFPPEDQIKDVVTYWKRARAYVDNIYEPENNQWGVVIVDSMNRDKDGAGNLIRDMVIVNYEKRECVVVVHENGPVGAMRDFLVKDKKIKINGEPHDPTPENLYKWVTEELAKNPDDLIRAGNWQ